MSFYPEEERHVFIDYPHLRKGQSGHTAQSVTFSAENIASALGKGKPGRRIVAGSEANGLTRAVGQDFESAGFAVRTFAHRASTGVDEGMFYFLLGQVEELKAAGGPRHGAATIVLVSGHLISHDGTPAGDYASFYDAAKTALENGFRVELYSWSLGVMDEYRSLQERFSASRMRVILLSSIVHAQPSGADQRLTLATLEPEPEERQQVLTPPSLLQ